MTAVQDQHCITQYLTPQVLIGSLNSDSINTLVEDLFAILPPSLSLSLKTHTLINTKVSLSLSLMFLTLIFIALSPTFCTPTPIFPLVAYYH